MPSRAQSRSDSGKQEVGASINIRKTVLSFSSTVLKGVCDELTGHENEVRLK